MASNLEVKEVTLGWDQFQDTTLYQVQPGTTLRYPITSMWLLVLHSLVNTSRFKVQVFGLKNKNEYFATKYLYCMTFFPLQV